MYIHTVPTLCTVHTKDSRYARTTPTQEPGPFFSHLPVETNTRLLLRTDWVALAGQHATGGKRREREGKGGGEAHCWRMMPGKSEGGAESKAYIMPWSLMSNE